MIIISWIALSFVVGAIGSNRTIGFGGSLFASLILSPIIGIVIVCLSKDKQTDKLEKILLQQALRGNSLSDLNEEERVSKVESVKEKEKKDNTVFIAIAALILIGALYYTLFNFFVK